MRAERPRCPPWLLLALWLSLPAWADGVLTHLSGPVSVKKADGRVLPGQAGTKVGVGDTVITGAGGFVRVEMTDGGEMVLRPESQLKVERYAFVQARPAEDNLVFSMLKGGIRTVTGLIGKRGNQEAYEMKTPTATVGIRGTQFDARVCQGDCGALADGTYLAVRFGAIQTTNALGTLPVAAGQVVHVPPQRPPLMLPRDPGIGFTPPPVIPKLDERKKLQQQAPPAATPTPGAPATSDASAKAESGGGQTAGKATNTSTGQPSGEAQTTGSTSNAAPSATPTAAGSILAAPSQTTSGAECSVQ